MRKRKGKPLSSVYAVGTDKKVDKSALSQKQKFWAYEKWCEGYTLMQIADALDVCEKTIRRAIHGRPRIRPILKYPEGEENV
jgi:hypothetical protein